MTFLFVDRLLERAGGDRARFAKCCSLAEDYYMQHFPGLPVLPGALLLEGFAQATTLLLAAGSGFTRWPLVRGISHARFLGMVQPGDRVEMEVRRAGADEVGASAEVEGRRVASAKLQFELLDPARPEHEAFRGSLEAARALLGMLEAAPA